MTQPIAATLPPGLEIQHLHRGCRGIWFYFRRYSSRHSAFTYIYAPSTICATVSFVVARAAPTSMSDMSDIAHAAERTRAAARRNRERRNHRHVRFVHVITAAVTSVVSPFCASMTKVRCGIHSYVLVNVRDAHRDTSKDNQVTAGVLFERTSFGRAGPLRREWNQHLFCRAPNRRSGLSRPNSEAARDPVRKVGRQRCTAGTQGNPQVGSLEPLPLRGICEARTLAPERKGNTNSAARSDAASFVIG